MTKYTVQNGFIRNNSVTNYRQQNTNCKQFGAFKPNSQWVSHFSVQHAFAWRNHYFAQHQSHSLTFPNMRLFRVNGNIPLIYTDGRILKFKVWRRQLTLSHLINHSSYGRMLVINFSSLLSLVNFCGIFFFYSSKRIWSDWNFIFVLFYS